MITITEYCRLHRTSVDFFEALEENDIMVFESGSDGKFIVEDQIPQVDRYRLLFYELHINMEGIDVIRNLLERQQRLLSEIRTLRNTLKLYE